MVEFELSSSLLGSNALPQLHIAGLRGMSDTICSTSHDSPPYDDLEFFLE